MYQPLSFIKTWVDTKNYLHTRKRQGYLASFYFLSRTNTIDQTVQV